MASARPIKLLVVVPYSHAGVSNEDCRAISKLKEPDQHTAP
jgi:hypothetical protein